MHEKFKRPLITAKPTIVVINKTNEAKLTLFRDIDVGTEVETGGGARQSEFASLGSVSCPLVRTCCGKC